MKHAFFGGTFDPPHFGHIKLAMEVVESGAADKLTFIPAPHPPHKTYKKVSAFEHRFKMLELSISGYQCFDISDIEKRRSNQLSYTIDTMRELKSIYSEDEFYILIGGDSMNQLHTWYMADELINEFELLIYPRPDSPINKQLLIDEWGHAAYDKFSRSIIDLEHFDISSTRIRKMVSNGDDITGLVKSEVKDYILANELYR